MFLLTVPSTNAIKKPLEGAPAPDYLWASEGIALICFTSGKMHSCSKHLYPLNIFMHLYLFQD